MTSPIRPLSRGRIAAYAAPAMALAIPTIPVAVMLPAFYAETFGLPLAAIGGVLAAARLLDVITDPLAGAISDRWRGRFGRRKPMMVLGAPLAGLALFMLFIPPADVSVSHLAIWASLLYLGWTMIALPYTAWGAELSPDYQDRSRITLAREGAQMTGILIAAAIPVMFSADDWQTGLKLIVIATLVGGAISLAVALRVVPDPVPIQPAHSQNSVKLSLYLQNKPFMRLLSAWLLNGLANGFPTVLFAFFVTHVLGGTDAERNWLLLLYFGAGVAGVPLWMKLAERVQKHRVWSGAMIFNCAAFAIAAFLGPGDIPVFAIVCLTTGLALGADLALPPAIQADVVDYDTLRSGRKRAGIYFAFWNMATKFALAGAVGIAFLSLDILGFDAQATEQSATATDGLIFLYAVMPILLKFSAIALIYRFPIDADRQAIIRQRLQQREDLAVRETI